MLRMNRIVAVLGVIATLFVGLTAVSLQLNDYSPEVNTSVFDGITGIANVSITVFAIVGVFCAGIVILFGAIATMGGR